MGLTHGRLTACLLHYDPASYSLGARLSVSARSHSESESCNEGD